MVRPHLYAGRTAPSHNRQRTFPYEHYAHIGRVPGAHVFPVPVGGRMPRADTNHIMRRGVRQRLRED